MNNIEEHLIRIAEHEGIVKPTLKRLPKIEDGQGYLSNINIVDLEGKTESGEVCKLSLVLKLAATNEKLRQCSATLQIFQIEIRMYESVFSAFHEFEKQKCVTNPFDMVPKCYKTFANTKPEILIFENLNENGYQSWNRKLQMDAIHVEAVLKAYARFHALSFAIRDQNPEQFKNLTENFENGLNIFFKRSGMFYGYTNRAKKALMLLDPNLDSKIFEKYKKFVNKVEEKFDFLISDVDDFYAILHGDCWCNNMLFKYKEGAEFPSPPTHIKFIDFQLSRLGSPVLDIAHFFYVCSSKEVLKDFQNYKKMYYDTFSKHLKDLGSNPEKLYPFSVYDKHWVQYATFGLIFSLLENHVMLSQDSEIISFEKIIENGGHMEECFDYEIANIDEYKTRMRALIEHFVDNDFI